MPSLVLVVPGRLETPTGGYVYDRRIVAGLRSRGWSVEVRNLDDSFPNPTAAALADAARVLASIPDGATMLLDGLAGGAMPAEIEREAARLRIVALVHHPLAKETGLARAAAAAFVASETRALACSRRVVVTSRATAAALTADYGVVADRIAVVEPGVDRAPLATGSSTAVPELLCVATVTPRKGHLTLVRALAMIRHLAWHLTCAGSLDRHPPTVDRLRAELRSNGLERRVSLVGDLDEAALGTYYSRANLFVLPTEHEGYGMAVAEALARGLPVVSAPTGAIPDLLAGGAGLIVPAGDARALADALRQALGDASVRERLAQGAARVRSRLPSWESASEKMANVLEGVATDG